jgi:hypothetical protein
MYPAVYAVGEVTRFRGCYAFPDLVLRLSSRSSRSVARSCIPGTTWEYVSSVNWMLEWPSRSCTTFGCSPANTIQLGVGKATFNQCTVDHLNDAARVLLIGSSRLELNKRPFETGRIQIEEVGHDATRVHRLRQRPGLEHDPRCLNVVRRDTKNADSGFL